MSENTENPNSPSPNKSWLLSEAARRTLEISQRNPVQVATEINVDIKETAQEILGASDPSESVRNSPVNVVVQREFSFGEIDTSLIADNNLETQLTDRRTRPYLSRTPSQVSLRRDFSLTSYESDLFDPEEIYAAQRMAQNNCDAGINDLQPEDAQARPIARARITEPDIEEDRGTSAILHEMLREIREIRVRLNNLEDRVDNSIAPAQGRNTTHHEHASNTLDVTYGRTHADIRNRTGTTGSYLTLKDARQMIPEFDGTSRNRVREFLNASTYAIKNIHPIDEQMLLEAIVCTKLKGNAMLDFETRDVRSYEQLKTEIEREYLSKRSSTHLQVEFNSLKQKYGENAQTFGRRVDTIAMELYESMIEGGKHTTEQQRTILDMIKLQALQNFQIGLSDEIKLIVRSQNYKTLQEAIAGATAEEKVKGPTYRSTFQYKNKTDASRPIKTPTPQCHKCKRTGHYAKDCRSKFALPRAEGQPRINSINKYCNYCKKTGHARDECWSLNGKPTKDSVSRTMNKSTYQCNNDIGKNRKNYNSTKIESSASDDDTEKTTRKTRTAADYRVTHVKRDTSRNIGIDTVTLPIRETAGGKINLLFDTGASISILKLKTLKGTAIIHEEKINLTGITGHTFPTLGKTYATVQLADSTIKHPFYVINNDITMEYDGLLGADFIKKHVNACNYKEKTVKIRNTDFKLHPYRRIMLPPRSETIVQVTADRNMIGITQAEELSPGVFIGSCLVEPEDFECPVSILNSTESAVDIQLPRVTIKELINEQIDLPVNNATIKNNEIEIPREEKIKNLLKTKHLNQEEKKMLLLICEEYSDVFHLEGEPLTCTSVISHEITTRTDSASVNVRPYRLPEKHKFEVNCQINEMLKHHIIQPSISQWNAPLLVVPKKADASGKPKLRIVIDFRKLNDLTIGDSFPLPNITDILDQLGNAKYFTTLDLASGYHQIPMSERDKEKTAFSTSYGHYEFNRMPFGLKNAPATFQRLMNTILTGMQGIKCLVYLDDIVIYGPSLEEHNRRLIEVLKRLRKNNLKLQPDKCEFLRKEVIYLGHIITENGIQPDPSKLEAVNKFPVPNKIRDIQSFIGLAGYYRKFIEDFSKIAKPLTKLTRKTEKFVWTTEQQQAFDTLKRKLTTAPVLKYPDFEQEFIVTTDASDFAIGAVLSQGTVGQDHPIAYASRVLSKAEQNYNTTEKELLAIVWATKHFRPYIYGTKFKIITDHKPLIWLFNIKDPGSRLIRWRLKIEEYDYEIIHKAGKANANADALSRNIPIYVHNLTAHEENSTSKKYTEEEKQKILYEYHNAPTGGHQGIERTLNRIRMNHTWPGITKDVENYITKCEQCQKNKTKRKQKAPLIITETPDTSFEKCALDIVGPLPITNNGNKYILTFQDCLTKFSKAIPIANQEAATIAKEFTIKIVLEHGVPRKILTDQGTNFVSEMFRNVCRLLKIDKIQTTAYHPESNGALERTHRTLTEYLRHYINEDQTDWDEWLPYAIFTFNTTPHTATGYTPFELLYGYQVTLPSSLSAPPKATYSYDNYLQELRERLRATNQIAKEHLKQEKQKAKDYQDVKAKEIKFKIGDKVLLHDETLRRGRSKKLDAL